MHRTRTIELEHEYRRGYVAGYKSALTEATALLEHQGMDPDDALGACYAHAGDGLKRWEIEGWDRDLPAPAAREVGW